MGMRHNHEMTVIVGIAIQHHKGRVPTPENQVLDVILYTYLLTKNTARRLVSQNIGHTPRCPDDIGHAPSPPFVHSVIVCPVSVAPTHCSRSTWKMPCGRRLERTATYGLVW